MTAFQSSRFKRRAIVVAALLALAGGGAVLTHKGDAAAKDKATETPTVLELASSDLARVSDSTLIQPLALSGTLNPVRQTLINAEVDGVLREVLVRPGETVQAGQILARFEASDLNNQLAARAATRERARAELELAKKNRERNANLLKQGFISPNAYDESENAVAVAAAQLKAEEAQAALASKAVSDGVVRAPFGGIVASRKVEPGTRVGVNQTLFSLVDLDELEFEASVAVSRLPAVKQGQPVRLNIEGFGDKPFNGSIERIAPVADAGSRMVPVYVRVKNPGHSLRGGMFAQGEATLAQVEHAATLPFSAIREMDGKAPFVLAVENGKIVTRPIKLGLLNDLTKQAEISAGLKPGAVVVIAKIENLKPGQAVKLPPAKPAA
ncbi:efflux RND transporter periplasmic adaptor subunit [Chitinimonas taiwanensis]|jgi:RND family efflux transporter MFP subunit|uniref:efflux RND transporter periplasmic adaptor subunit n=1 Tax=Chitinimonas taiwanensis TaxID=240412 RepID=UPI0035B26A73